MPSNTTARGASLALSDFSGCPGNKEDRRERLQEPLSSLPSKRLRQLLQIWPHLNIGVLLHREPKDALGVLVQALDNIFHSQAPLGDGRQQEGQHGLQAREARGRVLPKLLFQRVGSFVGREGRRRDMHTVEKEARHCNSSFAVRGQSLASRLSTLPCAQPQRPCYQQLKTRKTLPPPVL